MPEWPRAGDPGVGVRVVRWLELQEMNTTDARPRPTPRARVPASRWESTPHRNAMTLQGPSALGKWCEMFLWVQTNHVLLPGAADQDIWGGNGRASSVPFPPAPVVVEGGAPHPPSTGTPSGPAPVCGEP